MKILLYCGINNLVNFSRIRPYFDLCYGFDANPDKVDYARKIYADDPGVKIIYGALTEKGGDEVEFTITTDWDPAASLGSPNPDYIPIKNNPELLTRQKKIKVPTINLHDFCDSNNISDIDTLITDLQGIDYTVLKTLSKFIQAGKIREIQCEVEPDGTPVRYLGIPPGKMSAFQELLSDRYDILWIDPPGPPENVWEMDVRWRLKNSELENQIEFVVEDELLVPLVKSFLINFVYGHQAENKITAYNKGNVSFIWSANPIDGCDVYVYHNAFSYRGKRGGIDFLLMLEPSVVLPGEYDDHVWNHFTHVFGLFDALPPRGVKFHKIFFPRTDMAGANPLTTAKDERESLYPLSGRKNAICMISGNKSSHVPHELYSKRIEVARWFADHSKIPFDVYGAPPFALPNYRGPCPVAQKLNRLKQYRYNLCFENTDDPVLSAGYVTEKILDCLETRTIPIYLGATNIEQYIPPDCFIDLRNFADYRDLDAFLTSMTEAKYKKYIECIDDFVCAGGLNKYSETELYHQIVDVLTQEKILDARYFDRDIYWKKGPSSAMRQKSWTTQKTPPMWTWKFLSKADPPLVQNGQVASKQPRPQTEPVESGAKTHSKAFSIGKKTSIKILIGGTKFNSGNARRGYSYTWWNLYNALNHCENIQTSYFDYATESQQNGIAGMSQRLEEIILGEKPDVFFYTPDNVPANILSGTIKAITDSTDTQTIIWRNDGDQGFESDAGLWPSCADYIIATSPEIVLRYQKAGLAHKMIPSQWACNPLTYHPQMTQKTRDISFIGSARGVRPHLIDEIRKSGLKVDVFGDGWHEDSFIPFYDMVRIFGQSKINLNLCDTPTLGPQSIKKRLFEIMGCGGFAITTPMENLEEYYEPDKEIVVVSSVPELIDKARYYLSHESERENIARRGYARTIANHTWTQRLSDIIKQTGFRAVDLPHQDDHGATLTQFSAPIAMNAAVPQEESSIEATISITAYNQLHYTRQCVESVLQYTKEAYELLLVDNGSTDGTYEYFQSIKQFHPRTRVIKYFSNRVVEENGNYLLSIVRGKYYAGVTNDTMVHEDWLENFLRQMKSAPDIGIVGPRSNNISGPQLMPGDYDTAETYQNFAARWSKTHAGENFFLDRIVGAVVMMNMAIPLRIGGYDPDLPTNGRDGGYGFSDDDFSLRFRLGGYKSLVANDVYIHHYGSKTAGHYRQDLFGQAQNINKNKFFNKLQRNDRITIEADGKMTLKPYGPDDVIPVDERTVIRFPRICFVRMKTDPSKPPADESRYADVVRDYHGQFLLSDQSLQSLIFQALEKKEYDFMVILDPQVAPTPGQVDALTDAALCHPDVAITVPVGHYAPSTHTPQDGKGVEIIPYADLSVCALNLKLIRPLARGLACVEDNDEFCWFLQRRIRGEGYFISRANDIIVNAQKPQTPHPYDGRILPEQLIRDGQYARAEVIYHEDILLDPSFAESYFQLSCLARKQSQNKEAVRQAERALAADPHHIGSLILLSSLEMEQNNWKRASSFIAQANLKQPGNPEVQKIVEQYEKAVKENPDLLKDEEIGKVPSLTNARFEPGRTSIIIAASSGDIRECLQAVKQRTAEPYELIVIDGLASAEARKKLRKSVKELNPYKMLEWRAGNPLLPILNQAIDGSTGEYIVLLCDDVVVSEGWLTDMLFCLNHAPDAGLIGPVSNQEEGLQRLSDAADPSAQALEKFAAQFRTQYHRRQIPCRSLGGFCLLFKRDLAQKIGLFDETFIAGQYDDEDFCLRAALAGYQNHIAGDVFVQRRRREAPGRDRSILDKKWTADTNRPEAKALTVLKATELAGDFYFRGDVDRAVETLVDCIKIAPDAARIYYELIRIFSETGRFGEAWAVVESMPDSAKNDIQGLESAGYAKEGLGLDDEACAYAEKILSLNENHPAALNLMGVAAFKKMEKDKAQTCFSKAVTANPGYAKAYANLGVLYWGLDKKEEAFAYLQKGFRLSPTVPDHQTLYHTVASSLERFAEAETDFRQACRLYPQHRNLSFLHIDLLLRQEKYDAAILEIEDALEIFGPDEGTLNAALTVRDKIGPLRGGPEEKDKTLSLCMIVKNEEAHLIRCLKSVRDIADEIILVDTGSADKTKDIAAVFGAKVHDFPWTGDFAAARNHSLAQATGDWILVLDADEVLSPVDHDAIRALLRKSASSAAAYCIETRNYISNESIVGWTPNDGRYPEETRLGWFSTAKVRLFPRRNDVFFVNPVHEMVEDSLHEAGIPVVNANVVVHHFGKLDLAKDFRKGEDYYLLGKMKYESDPTNVRSINELARQAQLLGKYEEAKDLWLKLLALLEADPESQGYRAIAHVSHSDPLSETRMQIATAYLALDRYEEALAYARRAMEACVKSSGFIYFYVISEILAGSAEKASSALDESLAATPEYSPALFLKAIISCLENDKKRARDLFQSLRQKRFDLMTARLNNLARQLLRCGKKTDASRLLSSAMENEIGDAETMKLWNQL